MVNKMREWPDNMRVNELDKPYIVEMPTYTMSLSKKQANISDIKQ